MVKFILFSRLSLEVMIVLKGSMDFIVLLEMIWVG